MKPKPNLILQLDIIDFKDDKEILSTIKKLLVVSRDREFIDSVDWGNREIVKGEISPNLSFIIRGCICE